MARMIDEVLTDDCEQRDWERAASRASSEKAADPELDAACRALHDKLWRDLMLDGRAVVRIDPAAMLTPTTPPARPPTMLQAVLIVLVVVGVWVVWL